jgi:hypothetical protein
MLKLYCRGAVHVTQDTQWQYVLDAHDTQLPEVLCCGSQVQHIPVPKPVQTLRVYLLLLLLPLCCLQDRRFNRVAVQQLCVGAFPWLDWIGADKAAEVGQLATWLRWLSVQRWGQPGVAEHARLQPLQPRNYFEEFLEGFAEPQEPPGEGGQPDDDIDLDSVSEDSDDWAAPAADRQQLWGAHEEALLEQLLAADAGEMMQQEDVEWM